MERYNKYRVLIILLICLFASVADVCVAQPFQVEVTADNLNVRPVPPKFTLKTILTFKYQLDPPIAVVPKGTRLNVLQSKIVGDGAEWLEVNFTQEGLKVQGWVYAGRQGHWQYVRRIAKEESQIKHFQQDYPRKKWSLLALLASSAWANTTNIPAVAPDEEEGTPARKLLVIAAVLVNVIIFLGAMFVAKKIHDDVKFLVFAGISTLLIEGIVTEAGFWGWVGNLFN
ncbi:MAG: hypothetical protein ACFFCW_26265 [Candidatus Hodarchaeota archaeon]